MERPNRREARVLQALCLGNIEHEVHLEGVGPRTYEAMRQKGWIERACDDTYGVDGNRLTELGQKIHATL